jgi:hypothetical protein
MSTKDPRPPATAIPVPGTVKAVPGDEAPAGLRRLVIARTQRVQRRRRWTRRSGLALAAALFFAAGYGSARLAPVATRDVERVEVAEVARAAVPTPVITPSSDEPEELELAAEASASAERSELLLRAGDAYLVERGDIERALRCYRRYLASAPAPSSTREESWLLTALRTQRL